MKKRRILYRTRGGPTQGWGNIVRLTSFADWCRERGHQDVLFAVEGPDDVAAYVEEQGFEVLHLGDDVSLESERAALEAHGPFDLVFVEMLDVTPARQRMLRAVGGKLVVFDDLCDHVYDADLVVCGQGLPSHANQHLSADDARFLVGYDYFLSRPEFLSYVARERTHRDELQSVLVTLGGGRYDVGYRKAALAIAEASRQCGRELDATFVLGPAEADDAREELVAAIEAVLPQAKVLGGVANLDQLLWQHDVALTGGGYTKLEAAITQTPQVVQSVQWHQIPLASTFAAVSGVADVGYMSYVQPAWLATQILALAPVAEREEQAESARSVVDGLGFERVYAAAFDVPMQEVSCTAPAA